VLVFHIKRFEVFGAKINKFFEYRKEIKMNPFIDPSDNVDGQSTRFKLIGLTEHEGRTDTSGHYVAYTLRGQQWYRFDDEEVSRVKES
jgi:ubiquitin C-terminal hydrolase